MRAAGGRQERTSALKTARCCVLFRDSTCDSSWCLETYFFAQQVCHACLVFCASLCCDICLCCEISACVPASACARMRMIHGRLRGAYAQGIVVAGGKHPQHLALIHGPHATTSGGSWTDGRGKLARLWRSSLTRTGARKLSQELRTRLAPHIHLRRCVSWWRSCRRAEPGLDVCPVGAAR